MGINVNTQNKVVALVGLIGSGKDTVADFLVNDFGYKRMSFAGTLKDAVAAVFGWDRELLEGKTKEGRAWRETVDPWWAERLGMPDLTPRIMLQLWGTEVCRKRFHTDIWVASVENQLRNTKDNIVISDCRFPNEIESMRNAGARVGWVKRGMLPDWYTTACWANRGDKEAASQLELLGIHLSETSWVGTKFDFELENNGSLEELKQKTELLVD
jgi:hypothetical protein